MEKQIQNRLMDVGRAEESVRWIEKIPWKLTPPYVKESQWAFAVCLRELKQGLCISLEGGVGWEMGRRFKKEGTYAYL